MDSIKNHIPWSLRGIGPFLNTYGDPLFFKGIRNTPPISCNPEADTTIHSIVGRRFVNAYLVAIKSFMRFFSDVAVFVHDDGTLGNTEKDLILQHIPGAQIIRRQQVDRDFDETLADPFLSRVRRSYTSYLKLFDPTFLGNGKRIMLLDTDTLFLRPPSAVIEWARNGGLPWYHMAPRGNMKKVNGQSDSASKQDAHIQTLIVDHLDEINRRLGSEYRIEQGFCAGFVGYDKGMVEFTKLKLLLEVLYDLFQDRIFKWGSEQTIHALILCGGGARALPLQDYFVFTQHNAQRAVDATFIHFVGENRFYKLVYPRLASKVMHDLQKLPSHFTTRRTYT